MPDGAGPRRGATAFPVNLRLGRRADRLFAEALPQPALFVDRDGVLNADRHYLGAPDAVDLLPGAGAAVARANRAGVPVVVVSNQSGVGRGLFGWDAVAAVDERLAALLAGFGAELDLVVSAGAEPGAVAGAGFRKPEPSMFLLAARVVPIDLAASWMVGDKESDAEAARRAGLAGCFFVPGKAGEAPGPAPAGGAFAVATVPGLAEAVDAILPRLAAGGRA